MVEMLRVDWPFSDDDPAELLRKIRGDDEPNLDGISDEGALAVIDALLTKRKPKKRRILAERAYVGGTAVFSQDVWKISLVSPPPRFAPELGHLGWLDGASEVDPSSPVRGGDDDDDPWAGF